MEYEKKKVKVRWVAKWLEGKGSLTWPTFYIYELNKFLRLVLEFVFLHLCLYNLKEKILNMVIPKLPRRSGEEGQLK